jgi:hypothetical protein
MGESCLGDVAGQLGCDRPGRVRARRSGASLIEPEWRRREDPAARSEADSAFLGAASVGVQPIDRILLSKESTSRV